MEVGAGIVWAMGVVKGGRRGCCEAVGVGGGMRVGSCRFGVGEVGMCCVGAVGGG